MKTEHINKRIWAFVIDLVMVGIIPEVISDDFLGQFILFNSVFSVRINVYFIYLTLYLILFDLFNDGVTLGKVLMKIRVVDIKTQKSPKLSKRIFRTFLKVASLVIFPIYIYYYFKRNVAYDKALGLDLIRYA